MEQDYLGLKIGGIKILLRSEGHSLHRLAEVYRQFLLQGDSYDFTLELVTLPWRETDFRALGSDRQNLLFHFYQHYRKILEPYSPASSLGPLIDVLNWIAKHLGSKAFEHYVTDFSRKKGKSICVQPIRAPKGGKSTEGVLFLERGGRAGKFLWLQFLDEPDITILLLNVLLCFTYGIIIREHEGFLLHSSAVARRNKCYLFTGFSRSGKTTVASLAQSFTVLADDGIPVRRRGSDFYAPSTPWNLMYPPWNGNFGEVVEDAKIEKIFFLNRGSGVSFKELTPAESVARLIRHLIPSLVWLNYYDPEEVRTTFELCSQFCHAVACYDMYFSLEEDFWDELSKLP